MPHIDLDARRALLEPTTIDVNGHTYTLPVYLPAGVIQAQFQLMLMKEVADAEVVMVAQRRAYALIFGEDLAEQAMADFSDDDFRDLTTEVYKVTPGESPASVVSSPSTGTRPRRTSNGSTKST